MKARAKRLLERQPTLYQLLGNIYYALSFHHVKVFLLGTRAQEREWASRAPSSAEAYWGNRGHPSKEFLAERIASFSPVTSILEVGSNSGPNLYVLAKRFPGAEITGVDINAAAVEYGNRQFKLAGISNVRLLVGRADELGLFEERSFDIVFTNALLLYIGPDKIESVIKDMLRLSRRALVLAEWHFFTPQRQDPRGLGIYHHGNWVRDYVALLKNLSKTENIRVTKIPGEVWLDKGWQKFGAVIEVLV